MEIIAHIGLDVHKEKMNVAIAVEGTGAVEYYGEISNEEKSIQRLVAQVARRYKDPTFYYEAGPCGYGLYRYLRKLRRDCKVIAPTLIPRKAGDRVKTNRRDAENLARLGRAGELTAVAVPSEYQESFREVIRGREDARIACKRAKQHLLSFLLRHGKKYADGKNWSQRFYRWLESVKFETPEESIVLQDYIDTVQFCEKRMRAFETQIISSLDNGELHPIGQALMALRGVNVLTAATILTEAGDLRRFSTAQQFMSYVGLVPSEYSSGKEQCRGKITKCGNSHIRRLLIESAWCARHQARKTRHWHKKVEHLSPEIKEIAWKATKRLHTRYWRLLSRGKMHNKVVTAVARELAGFVWAIGIHAYKEQEQKGK